jgi:general secretion pathway protein G
MGRDNNLTHEVPSFNPADRSLFEATCDDDTSAVDAIPHSCGSLPEREGRTSGEGGFTLLEVLVVIVIIGLLVGFVAPAVLHQLGGARISIAKQSITRIGTVLDMYKLDVGDYPNTSDGLQALIERPSDAPNWNGPYLKSDSGALDPWNHPFVYRFPSDRSGHDYDLCSRGPSASGDNGSDSGMICNP